MPATETARLVSTLEMQDKGFSRTTDAANRKLSGMERQSAGATRGLRGLQRQAGTTGGALRGLGSSWKGFVGALGLTLGGAAVIGQFKELIGAAQEAGEATRAVSRLTGMGASDASVLVDVLGKYGIEGEQAAKVIGMQQKNLQRLAGTQKAAVKFQKEYGLSLVDANGKIVDSNELLLRAADYWQSDATATQKAAALSKIYGRQWQQYLPLLVQGRKGLNREMETALRLTDEDLDNLAKLEVAQRELNDTWGDTQVKLGLMVVPALTDLSNAVNTFLTENEDDIKGFFRGLMDLAREVGDAIGTYVVPALRGIADFWNAIPADLRKLLIAGIVGGKLAGMAGLSPGLLLGGLGLRGAAGAGAGAAAGGAAVGAAGQAAGFAAIKMAGVNVLKLVGTVGLVYAAVEGVQLAIETYGAVNARSTQQGNDLIAQSNKWLAANPTRADLQNGLSGVEQGIRDITANPLNVAVQGSALDALYAIRQAIIEKQFEAIMASPGYQSFREHETGGGHGSTRATPRGGIDPKTGRVERVGIEKGRGVQVTVTAKDVNGATDKRSRYTTDRDS